MEVPDSERPSEPFFATVTAECWGEDQTDHVSEASCRGAPRYVKPMGKHLSSVDESRRCEAGQAADDRKQVFRSSAEPLVLLRGHGGLDSAGGLPELR